MALLHGSSSLFEENGGKDLHFRQQTFASIPLVHLIPNLSNEKKKGKKKKNSLALFIHSFLDAFRPEIISLFFVLLPL